MGSPDPFCKLIFSDFCAIYINQELNPASSFLSYPLLSLAWRGRLLKVSASTLCLLPLLFKKFFFYFPMGTELCDLFYSYLSILRLVFILDIFFLVIQDPLFPCSNVKTVDHSSGPTRSQVTPSFRIKHCSVSTRTQRQILSSFPNSALQAELSTREKKLRRRDRCDKH